MPPAGAGNAGAAGTAGSTGAAGITGAAWITGIAGNAGNAGKFGFGERCARGAGGVLALLGHGSKVAVPRPPSGTGDPAAP